MNFRQFTVGQDDGGKRLDTVIRKLTQTGSLSNVYAAIRKGLIRVNGKKAAPDARVAPGDCLELADFLVGVEATRSVTPCAGAIAHFPPVIIEVIFVNNDLRILNKPYGVPVQSTDTCAGITDYCKQFSNPASLSFTPAPLHRLDRQTTGILVCSQSLEGARWFSSCLLNHKIQKRYLGLAAGKLDGPEDWEDLLDEDGFPPKIAKTHVVPLAQGSYLGKPVTLVEYEIATGRKHQIRAQSVIHRIPLLGDTRYGGARIDEAEEFYLHAWKMGFPPERLTGIPERVTAPLPVQFKKMLEKCLLNQP
jgi:23S rRNA pseudouridine955/2504/2580 synthase